MLEKVFISFFIGLFATIIVAIITDAVIQTNCNCKTGTVGAQ